MVLNVLLLLLADNFPVWGKSKSQVTNSSAVREHLLMNSGWRFALGNSCDPSKDFGAGTAYFSYFAKAGGHEGEIEGESFGFDDRAWRIIDLPHDWAVELPFDPRGGHSHGYRPLGKKFPETSIGWYRKSFFIPESDLGRRISIQFDGVFRDSQVWVNGFYLGEEHSGYTGFDYDITDYLNYGGTNVVAVRVDATMEEGWFYEGAGIYRDVWLNKTSQLHIASDGTFVTEEVKGNSANVTARATVANDGRHNATFSITQTIVDGTGKVVASRELEGLSLARDDSKEFVCLISVPHPNLWSIEKPYLYKLITAVYSRDSLIDRYETRFGIRTIRFDPDKGFFLNGKRVELKGTDDHLDFAGVGTAVPDPLQVFRVERLKAMGSNAIRCAHNPPAPAFLDVCDSLGMLVIDENRLMGTSPEQLDELKAMIVRDRNHPSVFVWSLGNEEWMIEGNVKGARIVSTMQDFAKQLDPSRLTTAATSGGWGHGISTVIDVMGFNYIFNGDIDKQHAEFPDQPGMGTEESTSLGTRGVYVDDQAKAHLEAIDRRQSDIGIERGFRFYAARPFLSGLFYWTGFDYRGEPNPIGWPQVTSQYGIMDLCGFPKDMFYYLESWWTDKPVLHLLPHWDWKEGDSIDVWAYSNCDEVELFLNNKTLGRKRTPEYSHLSWNVKYEPGTLVAVGYKAGREISCDTVATTGMPAAVKLIPDCSIINADGEGVSVVTAQVVDSLGRVVPTADNEINFDIRGPGRIIGVGNGDPSSHEPDKYLESVSTVKIEGLKIHSVSKSENLSEVLPDYDVSKWKSAFAERDVENRTSQDTARFIVIRGTFTLPELMDSTRITLLTKSLCQVQTIYVNGHLLAKDVRRDAPRQAYLLDHNFIHSGTNVYAVAGPPLVRSNRWEILNTDPGLVQIITPPQTWKRRAFNGLAQLIVQANREAGEIILTATSGNLERGTAIIETRHTAARPSVPAQLDDMASP